MKLSKAKRLQLNMARGKPCAKQLDLALGVLEALHARSEFANSNGDDCRNYGVWNGLPEMRAIFSDMLGVPADQIVLGMYALSFSAARTRTHCCGVVMWGIIDPSPAVARRVGQLLDRYDLHAEAGHRPVYEFLTFADEQYRLRLEEKVLNVGERFCEPH